MLFSRLCVTKISYSCYLLCFSLTISVKGQQSMQDQFLQIIENRTSCEEFLNNTTLDVKNLLDVDWKIFYFWNQELENSYIIRFSLPTKMLVNRFMVELSDDLEFPVEWDKAELFMETAIDFSALFIRTDTPGLYYILASTSFAMKRMPTMLFALKYVEPGYLGIMNCKYRLCYACAPNNKMPETEEEIAESAAKIGFRSEVFRSYLMTTPATPVLKKRMVEQTDDALDEEQLEIEADGEADNTLALF